MTTNPTTTSGYTAKARAIMESSMEPVDIAEAVAVACSENAGKLLTKRFADRLREMTGVEWTIRRNYGMTHVETLAYARSDWTHPPEGPRICLLLAHSEKNVEIPTGIEVEEKNPAYFEAARKRNKYRAKVLAAGGLPPELDSVLSAMDELGRAYEHVVELINASGCGSHSVPDWYAIRASILPENLTDSNKARHVCTDLA